jgi:hypothetical protein
MVLPDGRLILDDANKYERLFATTKPVVPLMIIYVRVCEKFTDIIGREREQTESERDVREMCFDNDFNAICTCSTTISTLSYLDYRF